MKDDLRKRLARLDPHNQFLGRYHESIARELGPTGAREGIPTVTYAVGGAGAQKAVAIDILHSAEPFIKRKQLRLNLIAGVRKEVADFFTEALKSQGLESEIGSGVRVLLAPDKVSYFREFNTWLRDTDVLWTKPSELVFFAGLGIPLIMTPPLGSHEEFNRDWLRMMGAGLDQEDPRSAGEWLAEWTQSGVIAEAAFDGYSKAPRYGTANIKALMFASPDERPSITLSR